MRIAMITPAAGLKRLWIYRQGGKLYGQPNSITGPLILGGILHRAGHEVRAYEEYNGRVDFRYVYSCDAVCIYTMTSTAPRAYELADRIHAHSSARVLIGGMHASAMPEEAARHADQVLVGEGEKEILDVIEGRKTGKIIRCEPICNLDEVPFPDYSILKTPCRAANVISTRGCPFRCTFCTTSRMFAPYRQRSIGNVMAELRMYKDMGFEYMNFEDDNFTADKERAKEICRRMIRENLVFKETFFFGRTDLARDEELLDLLKEAHLTRVLIGIESLNQEALDSINKHQNIDDIRKAAAACRDHGIRLIASIVLGLDEDGPEDIRRSIQFAKEIDAYQLQPAVLTPFPGTPVYEQMIRENRMLVNDWSRHDLMTVTFLPKKMTSWQLQDEFFRASKYFYDFRSPERIGRLFGKEYGWRRFGFAIFANLGPDAGRWAADHVKSSYYYYLKHLAPDAIDRPEKPVHNRYLGLQR
ncbi:MAG: B12-binding domain-containing radical SAM protein [Bulleidia sp.]